MVEDVFNLGLAEVVLVLVDDLKDFQFVVTLCQVPELLHEFLAKELLLQKSAEDIARHE